MALINCPECGKEISDSADCCPNCGYIDYMDEHTAEGVASIIIGVVAWIIMLLMSGFWFSFISFVIFVISLILEKKCTRNFAFLGFVISSLGILALVLRIFV